MTHYEVSRYANSRLPLFMLNGTISKDWTFQWGRGRHQLGCCRYRSKQILVSKYYVEVACDEDIKDTINHEIAHIIAGHRAGHGPEWKQACSVTGAKPVRCGKTVDIPSKYVGTCPTCKCVYKANRVLKEMNRRICAKKACQKPGVYVQWRYNVGV